jgi:hypothetical protein
MQELAGVSEELRTRMHRIGDGTAIIQTSTERLEVTGQRNAAHVQALVELVSGFTL